MTATVKAAPLDPDVTHFIPDEDHLGAPGVSQEPVTVPTALSVCH